MEREHKTSDMLGTTPKVLWKENKFKVRKIWVSMSGPSHVWCELVSLYDLWEPEFPHLNSQGINAYFIGLWELMTKLMTITGPAVAEKQTLNIRRTIHFKNFPSSMNVRASETTQYSDILNIKQAHQTERK